MFFIVTFHFRKKNDAPLDPVLVDSSSGRTMLCSFSTPLPQVFASPFHRCLQKMKIDSCDTAPFDLLTYKWITLLSFHKMVINI